MQLNLSLVKSVLTLYEEMANNGISLVYLGEFNHEITKMFTTMSQTTMEREEEEKSVKKRVYHSMVEVLQNMNKHSDEITDRFHIGRGLFMIGKKKDNYYIITSNKVVKTKVPSLKFAIEQVNTATKEELNDMYKKQLREGKLSNKAGAGLGLIDIVRKTGTKLQYEFLPLDDDDYFFILKVEISALSNESET